MLTCYDFQTAKTLNQTDIDLILVGDSLGNVILGYETTCQVSLQDMKTFSAAVKRGAPDKFTIIDMPFGTFANANLALKDGIELFQQTNAEALKIEGANDSIINGIQALTDTGIPIVSHWTNSSILSPARRIILPMGKQKKKKTLLSIKPSSWKKAGTAA